MRLGGFSDPMDEEAEDGAWLGSWSLVRAGSTTGPHTSEALKPEAPRCPVVHVSSRPGSCGEGRAGQRDELKTPNAGLDVYRPYRPFEGLEGAFLDQPWDIGDDLLRATAHPYWQRP